MAKRGTVKHASVEHEDFVALALDGKRSRSSGAADHDAGDVRTVHYLIECKMTGGPEKTSRKPTMVSQMEKITEEAFMEGRIPMLALRYYDPESILADRNGWIDLIVKRLADEI